MLRLQILLSDAQCPLVEWLGLRILPLFDVEVRQSMQRNGCLWMLRSHLLLPNAQRALVEQFGFHILSLLVVELCQSMQHNGHFEMF